MELVYTFKNFNSIEEYHNADAFLVETKFSMFMRYPYDNNELENIIETLHKNNKKVYLRCERMLLENEIEEIVYNKKMYMKADGIFFEDFGIVSVFEDRKENFKLIYFPFDGIETLEDVNVLLSNGIDKVILPHGKETLLKKASLDNVGISLCYHEILFTSRRKLLSLKDISPKTVHLIKEKTRDTKQRIIENAFGTIIYDKEKTIELSYKCNIVLYDMIFDEE